MDLAFFVLSLQNPLYLIAGFHLISFHIFIWHCNNRNEWFRRLIRSNRPLYRACPKHTKLLVSKAIVQAVEEQGGRFLEKSRDTGMWYVVPYKRAVDKTSQGLREKDKDDGPKVTNLPASLRGSVNGGKVPKPDLSHLAQVTMAQAGMPIRTKKPPPPMSKIARQQHLQQQKQKQQQRQRQMMANQQQMMAANQQMPSPSSNPRGSFNLGMNPSASMATAAAASGGPPIDESPPQPRMISSQSSMFRIFSRFTGGGGSNQSQMGGGGGGGGGTRSSWTMGFMGGGGAGISNNSNNNNNNSNNNMQMMNNMSMNNVSMNINPADPSFDGTMDPQQQMQMQQEMQRQQELQMQQEMQRQQEMQMQQEMQRQQELQMQQEIQRQQEMQMQQQRMRQQQARQQQQQMLQQQQLRQQQMRQQQQQEVAAPSLTRLTTQVSDWLTSFWPVNKGGAGGGTSDSQPRQRTSMSSRMSGSGGMMENHMRQQRSMNGRGSLQQQQMMAMMNNIDNGRIDDRGSSNRVARLSVTRLDDDDSPIPPPAEGRLESSVSTTLLKLASSPSKIFAGISTFFSGSNNDEDVPPADANLFDAVDNDDDNNIPPPPPAAGLGLPVGRPSSRKSDDLLDDYEETEMEARLRTVAGSS